MPSSSKYQKVYPKFRQRWSEESRKRGIDTRGMMSRFFSRFAMAHGFRAVVFDGYSPSSVRGYSSLLKLQLAYSAFDVFVKAANSIESQLGRKKKEIYQYTLINQPLAERLQQRHQLLVFLMKMCSSPSIVRRMHLFLGDVPCIATDKKLSERLQTIKIDFERGKDTAIVKGDVLFIAASLRHGVAHGDMSLHSVGVESSAVVKLIDELANQVLKLCEDELEKITEDVQKLPMLQSSIDDAVTEPEKSSQGDQYLCTCNAIA